VGFRSAESAIVLEFEEVALESQKELLGKKMKAPIDAYRFLEKLPLDQMAYLMAESNKSAALSKIRAYLNKWRPVRLGLPGLAAQLEALGMPRGPKFDNVVEQVFAMQLTGRGKRRKSGKRSCAKSPESRSSPKRRRRKRSLQKARTKHTPRRQWAVLPNINMPQPRRTRNTRRKENRRPQSRPRSTMLPRTGEKARRRPRSATVANNAPLGRPTSACGNHHSLVPDTP